METAISLKTGEFIKATDSDKTTSKRLLLSCPECGEPVYLKKRIIPNQTLFFSHYENIESRNAEKCSLRVEGISGRQFSLQVKGIYFPQLIDQFQKEFCQGIYNLINPHELDLLNFRINSNFENLDNKSYSIYITEIIDNRLKSTLLNQFLTKQQAYDFELSIKDIEKLLRSQYGRSIGNFIYQTAYLISLLCQKTILTKQIGENLFKSDDLLYFLVFDKKEICNIGNLYKVNLKTSDIQYKAIENISGLLVSLLIIRWRFKVYAPRIFTTNSNFKIDNINPNNSIKEINQIDKSYIKLSANEQEKIETLIKKSQSLKEPKSTLRNLNDLYEWSGGKTPLEALFLAKFKQVDIKNLKYENNFLVDDWVYWAKIITSKTEVDNLKVSTNSTISDSFNTHKFENSNKNTLSIKSKSINDLELPKKEIKRDSNALKEGGYLRCGNCQSFVYYLNIRKAKCTSCQMKIQVALDRP